jgi:hypothetical protein
MYMALVLACLISDPNQCLVLEDQRGPYKTYERCEARALEMSQAIHLTMSGFKPYQWKCKPVAKGQLSSQW